MDFMGEGDELVGSPMLRSMTPGVRRLQASVQQMLATTVCMFNRPSCMHLSVLLACIMLVKHITDRDTTGSSPAQQPQPWVNSGSFIS